MADFMSLELYNELKNHDFSIRIKNEKLKAKITDYEHIYQTAESICGGPPEELYQEEIFYCVELGRLKIRFNSDRSATLLRYNREELPENNLRLVKHLINSETLEFNAEDARKLHLMLLRNLGIFGGIIKERMTFKVGQIMIHLDTVEDLGQFVKIEVVRRPGQQPVDLTAISKVYQMALGIKDEDLTTCSYINMLKDDLNL